MLAAAPVVLGQSCIDNSEPCQSEACVATCCSGCAQVYTITNVWLCKECPTHEAKSVPFKGNKQTSIEHESASNGGGAAGALVAALIAVSLMALVAGAAVFYRKSHKQRTAAERQKQLDSTTSAFSPRSPTTVSEASSSFSSYRRSSGIESSIADTIRITVPSIVLTEPTRGSLAETDASSQMSFKGSFQLTDAIEFRKEDEGDPMNLDMLPDQPSLSEFIGSSSYSVPRVQKPRQKKEPSGHPAAIETIKTRSTTSSNTENLDDEDDLYF